MIKESQILLDLGSHWVCDNRTDYTVYITGITHSTSDSSYPKTEDGLSIAIARCKYLKSKSISLNH
jgi:hypothetical protein